MGITLKEYYKKYFIYWMLTIGALGISVSLCNKICIKLYLVQFVMNGFISATCVFILFFIVKRKSMEWKYMKTLIIRKREINDGYSIS